MSIDILKSLSSAAREPFRAWEGDSSAWIETCTTDIHNRYLRAVGKQPCVDMLAQQRAALQRIKENLRTVVKEVGADAALTGRIKSFRSICHKMQVRKLPYDEVLDLVGVRLIVARVEDCYRLIELIGRKYEAIRAQQRDYIVSPKYNGYQSLHMTVRDEQQVPIEIQVRTFRMHERAEYGPAAHGLYKLRQAKACPRDEVRPSHFPGQNPG